MNLYFGALIVGFLFSITPIFKKQIMTDLTKDEFQLYGLIMSIIIFLITSQFKGGLDIKDLKIHNSSTFIYLIISSSLVVIYSSILNGLLSENKPDNVMLNIKCVETIFLFLIACMFSNGFTMKKIFAVGLIILGSYLYQ